MDMYSWSSYLTCSNNFIRSAWKFLTHTWQKLLNKTMIKSPGAVSNTLLGRWVCTMSLRNSCWLKNPDPWHFLSARAVPSSKAAGEPPLGDPETPWAAPLISLSLWNGAVVCNCTTGELWCLINLEWGSPGDLLMKGTEPHNLTVFLVLHADV